MKALITTAVALAWALSSSAADAQVTFKTNAPEVGSTRKMTTRDNQSFDMKMKVGGQEQQGGSNQKAETTTRTEKILESDAEKGVTKLSISYSECKSKVKGMMGEMDMPVPFDGKTYHCTFDGSEIQVTTADGGKVSAEETERVRQDAEQSMGTQPLSSAFTKAPIAVGSEIQVPESIANQLFGTGEEIKTKNFTLKLTATEEVKGWKVGVFDVVLHMGGTVQEQMTFDAELKGIIKVEIDTCRLMAGDLGGPVKIQGQMNQGGMQITMDGQGTQKMQFVSNPL